MKNLKKDLQAVNKEIKALAKKTEKLVAAVAKIEKAQATAKKKAKAKVSKKAGAKKTAGKKTAAKKKTVVTATDQVLNIVKRSKKGIAVPALMKKTGFNEKKVRNIISRAFKQQKIKRLGRGLYVAA
ncbi:MAG: hypothetical protein JRI36_01810 [Deltaproteobacteria bacterium]|nr:hypothetical protein [Deltaproteobacteria bacterium]